MSRAIRWCRKTCLVNARELGVELRVLELNEESERGNEPASRSSYFESVERAVQPLHIDLQLTEDLRLLLSSQELLLEFGNFRLERFTAIAFLLVVDLERGSEQKSNGTGQFADVPSTEILAAPYSSGVFPVRRFASVCCAGPG